MAGVLSETRVLTAKVLVENRVQRPMKTLIDTTMTQFFILINGKTMDTGLPRKFSGMITCTDFNSEFIVWFLQGNT